MKQKSVTAYRITNGAGFAADGGQYPAEFAGGGDASAKVMPFLAALLAVVDFHGLIPQMPQPLRGTLLATTTLHHGSAARCGAESSGQDRNHPEPRPQLRLH